MAENKEEVIDPDDVLAQITQKMITELRHLKCPPADLVMVMSAVMILLEKKDHSWPMVVKELSNFKFL